MQMRRPAYAELLPVALIFYDSKATDRTAFEFLSLKGGCTGSSESTLVKMPYCLKSHVAAQLCDSYSGLSILIPKPQQHNQHNFTIYNKGVSGFK